jgi:hypothetical protein
VATVPGAAGVPVAAGAIGAPAPAITGRQPTQNTNTVATADDLIFQLFFIVSFYFFEFMRFGRLSW